MTFDLMKSLRRVADDERVDFHARGTCEAAEAEITRLCAALESLTNDPPATLAREPDEDWEVIVKMRAIARDALDHKQPGERS